MGEGNVCMSVGLRGECESCRDGEKEATEEPALVSVAHSASHVGEGT